MDIIGCDIDNTLLKFDPAYMDYIRTWSYEAGIESVLKFYNTLEFRRLLKLNDSISGLRRIATHSKIHLISARPGSTKEATDQNLSLYFEANSLPWEDIVFNAGHFQENSRTKSDVCVQNGITLMIEDSWEEAEPLAQAGIKVILLPGRDHDLPTNRPLDMAAQIIPVDSWMPIPRIVSSIISN